MASTEDIEQMMLALTSKIENSNLCAVSEDVGALLTQVKQWDQWQEQLLVSVRADTQRIKARALVLAEEAEVRGRLTKHVIKHRRMIEEVTHQAKTRTERIEGQVRRLCATLQPDWSSVEAEIRCDICFHKLWATVALVPCGHVFCPGCVYSWFQAVKDVEEIPQYTCMTCGVVSSKQPVGVPMIGNVVKNLPSIDVEEHTNFDSHARSRGYIGEESWSNFFS